ncbi:MAG: beta-galactosidase GalB [Chitinophagales bacterium]
MKKCFTLLLLLSLFILKTNAQQSFRSRENFCNDWKFFLGDAANAKLNNYDDALWRLLNLPHDWSIEGKFDKKNPAGIGGGALPGGVGWYRKSFLINPDSKNKNVFIDFDGVYRLSEVWINGHSLGIRPNGYISFRYDLTPYLNYGDTKNVIAVRVDNSQQPNSRWYSGSGIYRNVWMETINKIAVDQWGTFITTPQVSDQSAKVMITTTVKNSDTKRNGVSVKTSLMAADGKVVSTTSSKLDLDMNTKSETTQTLEVSKPSLWSIESPYLYTALTQIIIDGKVADEYTTPFGIRYFNFDPDKGFFLNGKHVKINGVCEHHDLGALGAALNTRALQRQLEILKAMGCNAIRTSHNPPAPELLDLCDQIGFIVMDEAFDMWKRPKTTFDYHLYWDEWHVKDLTDQMLRDRNHPSVMMWSVGNEIPEQSAYDWKPGVPKEQLKKDSTGISISKELTAIVRSLDATRPVTSANDHTDTSNLLLQSGAYDLICYNYRHAQWATAQERWGKKSFIATESASAFETRGYYEMPSDSIRRWPEDWNKPFTGGNAEHACSSYDNCCASWGSTHEESLKEYLKYDFIAGMFLWTGFDYIGEPTPYLWPSRSSYFGVIDLAGFPKDGYYLYQSLWTNKPVLHLLPHWNWKQGEVIEVWAYYNEADEVELFLNGKSLGVRSKTGDALHVEWKVPFETGTLKAVSRKNGSIVLTEEIKTAGSPAKILLTADRNKINADGKDLSFVTVTIQDANGNMVPDADNEVQFKISGEGFIAGVDNGSETSTESFKADHRKANHGLCLAIIQSKQNAGTIQLTASSPGLQNATLTIQSK